MSPPNRDTSLAPAVAGAAALLLLIAAWIRPAPCPLPLPPCPFRLLAPWPCPACGGTRCLMALSHGELRRAFTLNPLVTLAWGAMGAWFVAWLVGKVRQRRL